MMQDDIIFGLHAVNAALKHQADKLSEIRVESHRHNPRIRSLLKDAERARVHVYYVSRTELDAYCNNGRHQGIAARLAATSRTRREDELADILNAADNPLLLVLDGVQDPHNLGACLRSAAAAGVHAVIAPNDRAVGVTPTVRKVASGAAEIVPFIRVANLVRCLRALKDRGLWLVGAAGDAEISLYQTELGGPTALVLGAEEKGLRRLTRESCDSLAHIPMADGMESLNVSVATGVFLFEAVRQRQAQQVSS